MLIYLRITVIIFYDSELIDKDQRSSEIHHITETKKTEITRPHNCDAMKKEK